MLKPNLPFVLHDWQHSDGIKWCYDTNDAPCMYFCTVNVHDARVLIEDVGCSTVCTRRV